MDSTEKTAFLQSLLDQAGITPADGGARQFVQDAYEILLGYDDAESMENADDRIGYWVDRIESGEIPSGQFVAQFFGEAQEAPGRFVSESDFAGNGTTVESQLEAVEVLSESGDTEDDDGVDVDDGDAEDNGDGEETDETENGEDSEDTGDNGDNGDGDADDALANLASLANFGQQVRLVAQSDTDSDLPPPFQVAEALPEDARDTLPPGLLRRFQENEDGDEEFVLPPGLREDGPPGLSGDGPPGRGRGRDDDADDDEDEDDDSADDDADGEETSDGDEASGDDDGDDEEAELDADTMSLLIALEQGDDPLPSNQVSVADADGPIELVGIPPAPDADTLPDG